MLALWVAWSVLTLVVISLAIARKLAARNDDEIIHLTEVEAAAIPQQMAVAQKLEKLDYWGKTLTVVDVLFGVALVAVMGFNAWQQGAQIN